MIVLPLSRRLAALAEEVAQYERRAVDLALPQGRSFDDRGRSLLTPEKIAEQSDEALRLAAQILGPAWRH